MEDKNYWRNRAENDERVDWRNNADSWIAEYWKSVDHPHRDMIVKEVRDLMPVKTVFEFGSNCGVNLVKLSKEIDGLILAGADINCSAINYGIDRLKEEGIENIHLSCGDANDIPYPGEKVYDVSIIDAVLMYANADECVKIINTADKFTRKAIIIVDWFSEIEEINEHHYTRNYKEILERLGMKVKMIKIPRSAWNNNSWSKYGYMFVGEYEH